ncbi:MAG: Uma2 family endonuclease, partial [Gammaproteobacteria bacterium]|nr:Uma2 family endonuclease [Gammaproteobacteria bacterium]
DRNTYFCTRPCLIVEVLSESTERIDRREKFLSYQRIPSLREYLLIAQDQRRLEIFRRSQDWQREVHTQGSLHLECLEEDLSLDAVYMDLDRLM